MIVVLLLAGCSGHPRDLRDAGRLGRVELFRPDAEGGAPPDDLVFLFSGMEGESGVLRRTGRALADDNTAVVLVDLPPYLHGLAASDDGCHYLLSEIEELSQQLAARARLRGLSLAGARGCRRGRDARVRGARAVARGDRGRRGRGRSRARARHAGARCARAQPRRARRGGGFAYAPASDLPGPAAHRDDARRRPSCARSQPRRRAPSWPTPRRGDLEAKLVAALEPLLGGGRSRATWRARYADLPLVEHSREAARSGCSR